MTNYHIEPHRTTSDPCWVWLCIVYN